jgi:hypothetical protein
MEIRMTTNPDNNQRMAPLQAKHILDLLAVAFATVPWLVILVRAS